MKTRYLYLLISIVSISDLFILNLVFFGSYYLLTHFGNPITAQYADALIISNLLWLVAAYASGLYTERSSKRIDYIYAATAKSFVIHLVLFIIYTAFFKEQAIPKIFVAVHYGFFALAIFLNRFVGTFIELRLKKYFNINRQVAILGTNNTSLRLAAFFEGKKNLYHFEGFLDENSDPAPIEGERRMSAAFAKINYAAKNGIEEVYMALTPENTKEVIALAREAEKQCVRVKMVPDYSSYFVAPLQISYLDEFPVISLRHDPLEAIENRFKKRLFDIIFSSLVIVFILSWLYPLIGILIKLQSPGPILFKQERNGRNNKPFKCLKFRSMKLNAEADTRQATKGDDRVTPIGSFLRRTSLDELPQFINVFLGNMSVVGPRPHPISLNDQYKKIIDEYMVRHFLKAGITGWAQVNGYRGETKDPESMRQRVECDVWYLENWSIMLDIRIIFLTVINILRGEENAY